MASRAVFSIMLLVALVAAGCTAPPPDEDPAVATAKPPSDPAEPLFGPPTVVATQVPSAGIATEPTVAAAPDGTLYVSALYGGFAQYMAGVPGNAHVWRSTDDGASFTLLNGPDGTLAPGSQGNQDTDLYVDPEGGVHLVDLRLRAGGDIGVPYLRSLDQGETWEQVADLHTDGKIEDRQWIAGSGARLVAIWRAQPNAVGIATSPDRGDTWNVTALEVDHHDLGNVAMVNDTVAFGFLRDAGLYVMRSDDAGVTWQEHAVPGGPADARTVFFPTVALDAAGTTYAAISYRIQDEGDDRTAVYRAHTRADGSWSPLVAATEAVHALMPSLVAGDPGRVAMSYLATADAGDLETDVLEWHVHVQTTLGGDRNGTWTQTQVSEEPAHVGLICTGGGTCPLFGRAPFAGDRRMGEIFEAGLTADGSVLVTWPDTAHGATGETAILFAHQSDGSRMRSGGQALPTVR